MANSGLSARMKVRAISRTLRRATAAVSQGNTPEPASASRKGRGSPTPSRARYWRAWPTTSRDDERLGRTSTSRKSCVLSRSLRIDQSINQPESPRRENKAGLVLPTRSKISRPMPSIWDWEGMIIPPRFYPSFLNERPRPTVCQIEVYLALSSQMSRVDVSPGPIVTAAFDGLDDLSFGLLFSDFRGFTRLTDAGLASWAVGILPRGGLAERFVP